MARINCDVVAHNYAIGRAIPLEGLFEWREAVRPYVATSGARVLDVGSGTGLFARAFAEWFGVNVVALEPSPAMRRIAAQTNTRGEIAFLGGEAEHLPLGAGSCSVAWSSTVIHHISDLRRCASQLREVLRPGGHILIRSAFPGRHEQITLFKYFPGASEVANSFPTIEETTRTFEGAGFVEVTHKSVAQESAPSISAFYERARLRADTTLIGLTDEDFESGLRALKVAADDPRGGGPVVDRLGLLVLRQRDHR